EQSLNKSATAGQIDEIRKYAAAEWDAANAVKMRQQAEQGKKFAQQEIAAYKVMPDAQTGNSIDLLAQIDLEEQQKLAALAKYQAIDKENTQL
ncbi:phage tail tape-measure protein, partial [Enterobacter hormaechei subsp. xiangfangensis]